MDKILACNVTKHFRIWICIFLISLPRHTIIVPDDMPNIPDEAPQDLLHESPFGAQNASEAAREYPPRVIGDFRDFHVESDVSKAYLRHFVGASIILALLILGGLWKSLWYLYLLFTLLSWAFVKYNRVYEDRQMELHRLYKFGIVRKGGVIGIEKFWKSREVDSRSNASQHYWLYGNVIGCSVEIEGVTKTYHFPREHLESAKLFDEISVLVMPEDPSIAFPLEAYFKNGVLEFSIAITETQYVHHDDGIEDSNDQDSSLPCSSMF